MKAPPAARPSSSSAFPRAGGALCCHGHPTVATFLGVTRALIPAELPCPVLGCCLQVRLAPGEGRESRVWARAAGGMARQGNRAVSAAHSGCSAQLPAGPAGPVASSISQPVWAAWAGSGTPRRAPERTDGSFPEYPGFEAHPAWGGGAEVSPARLSFAIRDFATCPCFPKPWLSIQGSRAASKAFSRAHLHS